MEDFSSLFQPATKDYTSNVLEILFGGIINYIKTGDNSLLSNQSVVSTIFSIFNMVGLLCILVVSSYTVYTVIMDTAADGKTFGEQTNTRHTITRTLLGAIAFVPITGGYSLAQLILLWLVIMGSGLGDTTWNKVAESGISGQQLTSVPKANQTSVFLVKEKFAIAFDALVNGHLCAIEANFIYNSLEGRANDVSGPLKANYGPEVVKRLVGFQAGNNKYSYEINFKPDQNAGGYRGSGFCGYVRNSATLESGAVDYNGENATVSSDLSKDFLTVIQANIRKGRFSSYQTTINELSQKAYSVALLIHNNEQNADKIVSLSRAAIDNAANQFANGSNQVSQVDAQKIEQIKKALLKEATDKGWMFAPTFQRAISMAMSSYGSVDGDLDMKVVRENRLGDYLSSNGYRVNGLFGYGNDRTAESMVTSSREKFKVWDSLYEVIKGLGYDEGEHADESTEDEAARKVNFTLGSITNYIYVNLLNLMSPSGDADSGAYHDPLLNLSFVAQWLMGAGAIFGGLGITAGMANGIPFIGGVSEQISSILITMGAGLLFLGFIIGIVLPLIPILYYYSAVISWFLLIIESMFAVPLAILSLFAPARDGTLIGSWNRILLSIFGILLRPFFIIVGMVFAMIVMSFALQYLNLLFRGIMTFMGPATGIMGLVYVAGFLIVYVGIVSTTILSCSKIVTELGDGALGWLGVQLSSMSNVFKGAADHVTAGSGAERVAQGGSALGSRAENLGNKLAYESRRIGRK